MVEQLPLQLETVYPFFLESIRKTTVSNRAKIRMDWICTSEDCRVIEHYNVLPGGKPGEKLLELFSRLKVSYPNESLGPEAVLYMPTHITAKVQQHWRGGATERWIYELVMATVTRRDMKAPVFTPSIAPELKARVKKLVSGCKTRTEAQGKLEQIRKDYVPVLDEMIAAGEVKLEA